MATRQKRVTRRVNPIDSAMSDEVLPEVITKPESKAPKKVAFADNYNMTEKTLEDPRPRHKLELKAFIEKSDELKKRRNALSKSKRERDLRAQLTEELAQITQEFQARIKAEEQAYLDSLSEDQLKAERIKALRKLNEKKSWHRSRGKHTYGLPR